MKLAIELVVFVWLAAGLLWGTRDALRQIFFNRESPAYLNPYFFLGMVCSLPITIAFGPLNAGFAVRYHTITMRIVQVRLFRWTLWRAKDADG